uniref:RoaA n=1 Tax=Euglena hiemalis TaxID=392896 RepID=A0A345UC24_9EUGL|nr:RoaA [Euglena hiemalis]AXI98010.1 RoaA [Euglena hiemalis]
MICERIFIGNNIFSSLDTKLSFSQHEISSLNKVSSFRLIKSKERLLFKSFYARASVVRDCVEKSFFLPSIIITSRQNLILLLFILRNFFYYYRFYTFQNIKASFSFDFFSFYKFCFSLLLKITIFLLYIQKIIFLFNSRFTDFTSDVVLTTKTILSKNLIKSWYFSVNILTSINCIAKNWLFKNFPFDNKFLKNFLQIGNLVFDNSLFLLIFTYLFNGLLIKETIERFTFNNVFIIYNIPFFLFNRVYFFVKSPNDFSFCKNSLTYFFKNRGIMYNNINISLYNFAFNGFKIFFIDFLKFGSFLLLNITKKSINIYKLKLKLFIKCFFKKNIFLILNLINKKIRNWSKQVIFCFNKKYLCLELDIFLNKLLWQYVKKLHSKKNNTWIYSKYWRCFSGVWKFFILDLSCGNFLFLKSHLYLKDFSGYNYNFRFSKFSNLFNLYNKEQLKGIMFEKIKYTFLSSFSYLYNNQKGLCFICKKPIYSKNSKILTLKKCDSSLFDSLFLVHSYCNIN